MRIKTYTHPTATLHLHQHIPTLCHCPKWKMNGAAAGQDTEAIRCLERLAAAAELASGKDLAGSDSDDSADDEYAGPEGAKGSAASRARSALMEAMNTCDIECIDVFGWGLRTPKGAAVLRAVGVDPDTKPYVRITRSQRRHPLTLARLEKAMVHVLEGSGLLTAPPQATASATALHYWALTAAEQTVRAVDELFPPTTSTTLGAAKAWPKSQRKNTQPSARNKHLLLSALYAWAKARHTESLKPSAALAVRDAEEEALANPTVSALAATARSGDGAGGGRWVMVDAGPVHGAFEVRSYVSTRRDKALPRRDAVDALTQVWERVLQAVGTLEEAVPEALEALLGTRLTTQRVRLAVRKL